MDISNTQNCLDSNIFKIELGQHNEKNVIWISFPYSINYKNFLKENFKVKWSATQKKWYLLDIPTNRQKVGLETDSFGKSILLKIHPHNQNALLKLENMLKLKAYSKNTIRTYLVEFAQLLYLLEDKKVDELTSEKLQSYFLYCLKMGISENHLHSRINAIKFYYEKVMHRPKMFIDIPRPKKPQLLPKALNIDEIGKIIRITENRKHRLIIQLAYGMGLRVSEIVALKVEDIDSKTMKVFINRAKGKKDRLVNLPESILEELRIYYKEYRPKEYLFEGQYGDALSTRAAQSVFRTAMKKAGIRKTVGIHSLRHSYATHLLEYGTDVSLIQKLLGHNNIKTTLNYTHVAERTIAAVKSPLDRI